MNALYPLFLAILFMPVSPLAQYDSIRPAPTASSSDIVTCKEALQNLGKIKVGLKKADVKGLLGDPTRVEKGVWGYSFWECSPPPRAGEQKVVGLALTFTEGVISKIDYATICATGPGSRL